MPTNPTAHAAVTRSVIAFDAWSSQTAPARGKTLFKLARLMELNKKDIIEVIVQETFKSYTDAEAEANSAIEMCYYMAGEGRRLFTDVSTSEHPSRLALSIRQPIGPVLIITPWNFPFSLVAWKCLPALICGNSIVLKPSSKTPKSADLFVSLCQYAGIPKDTIVVCHGPGSFGEQLAMDDRIRMISFTGSTSVGKRLNLIAASRLIRCSLELGGKNAAIVLKDADLDQAAAAIAKGAFSVAGQRCSSTSLVIADHRIHDRLVIKLTKIAKTTFTQPVISQDQASRIHTFIREAARKSTMVCGPRLRGRPSTTIEPTIFTDVSPYMPIVREEVFGPVLCVIKVVGSEHAVELANESQYGLTASIFTKDINHAMQFIQRIQTGVCYVNSATFGAEPHMPFGGLKLSGNGHRECGKAAIECFSELKTVYINYKEA